MEAKEAVDKFRRDLADLKKDGIENVSISGLENYLSVLEQSASQSNTLRQIEHQRNLAHYDAQIKTGIEMFKSVIESGKEALNATILINGGAVAALLGFLSSLISKGTQNQIGQQLTVALLCFGSGVLFGALGFGVRYLTQLTYSAKQQRLGHSLNFLSSLPAVFAYSAFGLGVFQTYCAFQIHFAH